MSRPIKKDSLTAFSGVAIRINGAVETVYFGVKSHGLQTVWTHSAKTYVRVRRHGGRWGAWRRCTRCHRFEVSLPPPDIRALSALAEWAAVQDTEKP